MIKYRVIKGGDLEIVSSQQKSPKKLEFLIKNQVPFFSGLHNLYTYPPKTNMTMENPPFEHVFPIENGDFPMSFVSFQGCNRIPQFLGDVRTQTHLDDRCNSSDSSAGRGDSNGGMMVKGWVVGWSN